MLRPQQHAGSASAGEQQRQQLQSNPAWEASRFGDLETFIFDFLSGAAGGEGVRLKLQTPLNISQALLDAAMQQVQDDLEVAKQASPWPKLKQDVRSAWTIQGGHVLKPALRDGIDRLIERRVIPPMQPGWTAPVTACHVTACSVPRALTSLQMRASAASSQAASCMILLPGLTPAPPPSVSVPSVRAAMRSSLRGHMVAELARLHRRLRRQFP